MSTVRWSGYDGAVRRRWGQRLLGAAVLGLLGYGVFTAVVGGSIVSSSLPIRVRGVVVDAETGVPLEGVALLTLRDPGILRDPEGLAERRRIGRKSEEARVREGRPSFSSVGSAHTDAAGAFEIVVGIRVSYRTGWSGSVSNRSRESPFQAAHELLVEAEGYEPLVLATKDARWMEKREGTIVGTLEVGTIRLAPSGPK